MREPCGCHKPQYASPPIGFHSAFTAACVYLSAGPFQASAFWTGADHDGASCGGGGGDDVLHHCHRCVACHRDGQSMLGARCMTGVRGMPGVRCITCALSVKCALRASDGQTLYATCALCANFIVRCMTGLRSQMCGVCQVCMPLTGWRCVPSGHRCMPQTGVRCVPSVHRCIPRTGVR
jgi:hypothetical protein